MRPASKYYARKREGLWVLLSYHPRKEDRPPEARRGILKSKSLPKLLAGLRARKERHMRVE